MEEIKVKVWCEKGMPTLYLKDEKLKEKIKTFAVEFHKEQIVKIKVDDIVYELGHEGYHYNNKLYDIIHENYKGVDFVTLDGRELQYEICEEGMKDDIPYFEKPLESKEQFIELLKKEGK